MDITEKLNIYIEVCGLLKKVECRIKQRLNLKHNFITCYPNVDVTYSYFDNASNTLYFEVFETVNSVFVDYIPIKVCLDDCDMIKDLNLQIDAFAESEINNYKENDSEYQEYLRLKGKYEE